MTYGNLIHVQVAVFTAVADGAGVQVQMMQLKSWTCKEDSGEKADVDEDLEREEAEEVTDIKGERDI